MKVFRSFARLVYGHTEIATPDAGREDLTRRPRRATCVALLVATLFVGISASGVAQTTGQDGVAPDALRASYGFSHFNTAWGMLTEDATPYMLFGGRGGTYLGDSETLYLGGGGRGGFALDGDGGLGYGYPQIGWRGPLGESELGLDGYTGIAAGGYGSPETSGFLVGPTAGAAVYFGALSSFEAGISVEGVLNAVEPAESIVSIALTIGGKGGEVSIPWENRRDAGL